ncbi:sugar phosphate isomerase/epimerase [Streptomyces misionensis]|uniref:sugar phosphate isomerase/epimerase family protein n=1 Tax=Streptomyces misionensis TaxID=67331 RepID=UPI00340705E8
MGLANDDTSKAIAKNVRSSLVMPFANVRHLDYRGKVLATALAGFGQLSLHPHEARDAIKGGLRPEDMLDIASENEVALTRLDPLSNWNPRWLPTNMDAAYIEGFDIGATEFFELCEQLGIKYCSLNATFADDIYSTDEIVEHYASICGMAARYDVTCDLENLPMWGVKTLRQAWSIVSAADRPNGGIVFDTLHYIRSESTLDMLTEIPGDQIHCVQLNDGPLRLPAGVTLEENCFDRGWPGTGEFPLVEIVRTLDDMNALRQVSAEVFSPQNATRSAAEIADLSSKSLEALFDAAKVEF